MPKDAANMAAALDHVRLAYVVTGLPDVDAMSKAGLAGLGAALKARTSYEHAGPHGRGHHPRHLSFYPLLLLAMDPREKKPSPATCPRIADYMRLGGTILFDTR